MVTSMGLLRSFYSHLLREVKVEASKVVFVSR